MKTPIALIISHRPDTTKRVFAEIAKVRPPKLFIIADGPRANRPDDSQRCAAARAIVDRVDWDCDVSRNYSEINLGCGVRPATGISWVFEHVDKSIILEDDILPHPSFFHFCEEMLERYQDDERIMVISGMKSQFGEKGTAYNAYSYGFRRALSCWGWATWRRAWGHFDFEIKLWPKLRDLPWISEITSNARASEYYKNIFDQAFRSRGNLDYWDYQWLFTCWSQNGLCVVPNANLAINIGFGEQATHTQVPGMRMPSTLEEMIFPLKHPPYVLRDYDGDTHRYELRHPQRPQQHQWYNYLIKTVRRVMRIAGPHPKLRLGYGGDGFGLTEVQKAYRIWGRLKKVVKEKAPTFLKLLLSIRRARNNIRVSLRERRTRKHIKSIVKKQDTIFLELGAGDKKGKGEWLTIDLNSNCDVVWNLINGIPFPDNSVHKIYSSHLFEHFSFKDGQRLLDECKRVLIPGGIFSICVPNAKLFISAYLSDDNFDKDKYLSYKPANNCTSKIDCVNYIAYMDGHHKYMFDEENIIIILKNKGFKNVKIRDFDRNLDLEKRDWQSIYAQGEK